MELANEKSCTVYVSRICLNICDKEGYDYFEHNPLNNQLISSNLQKQANADELHANLKLKEVDSLLLHGDMDQIERNKVIQAFRKKECDILVATDVAARGLDIPHIRTVVNYDIARDIDTHTHRYNRTIEIQSAYS